MSNYRFKVGATVMCNLGQEGWKIGRIIATNYREDTWAEGVYAPYQVLLEENHSLIYAPEDDDRFCREATREDTNILKRKDALAALQSDVDNKVSTSSQSETLSCSFAPDEHKHQRYRKGRCFCCNDCPRDWSYVELYSEHYRCATRNNLNVTRHEINLGTFALGDELIHMPDGVLQNMTGFMQAPMLVRLPPGITFFDDGKLAGTVQYAPHRDPTYNVDFVAVSTVEWKDKSVGIVRLEIRFQVEGNIPPTHFDVPAFESKQDKAHSDASALLKKLNHTWDLWGRQELGNRSVCTRMVADLDLLRNLAETHPRLDNGRWWAHLGGFHMNVHKLLENTLFECELYLGYSLTFGDDGVRYYTEENLRGCYQKRLLEAARFMWYDGIEHLLENELDLAIETFKHAAAKKDGWGWAVNHGDIWLSEAAARMIRAVESLQDAPIPEGDEWIDIAEQLVEKARSRTEESNVFGSQGHPWINEVLSDFNAYKHLTTAGQNTTEWLEAFRSRTIFWCSQILSGVAPFPPKCRNRLVDEVVLIERLAGLHQ